MTKVTSLLWVIEQNQDPSLPPCGNAKLQALGCGWTKVMAILQDVSGIRFRNILTYQKE